MFKNFTIKNFRCFSGLTLQPLERVNLIAGKNNVGKTALLEAIYLHCYPENVELPFDLSRDRLGEGAKRFDGDACRWMFYDGHDRFELISENAKGLERTQQGFIGDLATIREQNPEVDDFIKEAFKQGLWEAGYPCLVFKNSPPSSPERSFSVGFVSTRLGGDEFVSMSRKNPWDGDCVFLSARPPDLQRVVDNFSRIELHKRQDEILPALRLLDARLERLSSPSLAGRTVIHGDIGLSQLVPVPFMGEGMNRLLSVVLAIANVPGGIVLIDEIENGLHHSVLKQVWQATARAARQANVQVFATTHSYECIQAAHQAFVEDEKDDLRLFRLDRVKGEIQAAMFSQETLGTAVEMSMEVR